MDSIWVEKYRPQTLEEFVGNEHGIQRLRGVIAAGSILHLLLAGPPGVGKTSSLHCIARQLLGPTAYKRAVLELNAADERGVDVVRDKIKNFAKEKQELPPGKTKIVILDEVDSMTEAAQQALRRLMEMYSDTTRFALACNQSEKVIDPIQSRCAIIRFTRVSDEQMLICLRRICEKEKLAYNEDALQVVVRASEGDMRRAIGALQAAAAAYDKVEKPSIYYACDIPPGHQVQEVLNHCVQGNWRPAHDQMEALISAGYTAMDLLKSLKYVLEDTNLNEARRHACYKEIILTSSSGDRNRLNLCQIDKLICRLCVINKVTPR